MPIYEYISAKPDDREASCIVCRKPFELRRNIDRSSELQCPTCKKPIVKLPSRISAPKQNYSDNKASNAGFTVLNNKGDGVFEKHQ